MGDSNEDDYLNHSSCEHPRRMKPDSKTRRVMPSRIAALCFYGILITLKDDLFYTSPQGHCSSSIGGASHFHSTLA